MTTSDLPIPDRVQLALDLGRARKQIERVRAIHRKVRIETNEQSLDWFWACASCREPDGVSVDYPCSTIRALDHPYEGGSRG